MCIMLTAIHTHPSSYRRGSQWLFNFSSLSSHNFEGAAERFSLTAPCFYASIQPITLLPSKPLFPKWDANCVIIKYCTSHFLHFLPSQLTHTITWQARECDKVNMGSTTDRKWILLWQNSNCNHFDKRKIGKQHLRLLGCFQKTSASS